MIIGLLLPASALYIVRQIDLVIIIGIYTEKVSIEMLVEKLRIKYTCLICFRISLKLGKLLSFLVELWQGL